MSTVIKSGAASLPQQVAFNLEDISQQAGKYLDQVRVQAAQIVVEAQKQADAVRRKAEEEGKQAAMRAVEKVLEEKVAKKMETLLPALQQVVRDFTDAKQTWMAHWEKVAVRLACSIAGKLVRQELKRQPEITTALVREALEMASGASQLRICLNPADVETLGGQIERLRSEFRRVGTAEIVGDARVTPGGCRLETQHGVIDQQFEAQLARIEVELTSGNQD